VLASLDKTCPRCGFTITPDLVKRVDFERIEGPECGETVQPAEREADRKPSGRSNEGLVVGYRMKDHRSRVKLALHRIAQACVDQVKVIAISTQ